MVARTEWRERLLIARASYRLGQFGQALVVAVPERDRALAAAVLTPAQFVAFTQLVPTDQRHAVRVLRTLLAHGERDADLLVAALLHDLGKVDPCGVGRVRLLHRVSKVIVRRISPALWQRISARPARGPLHGYYLLEHHPALGADWAAYLGVTPRACALIAAHQEDVPPGAKGAGALLTGATKGDHWDATEFRRLLAALRWADDRA